MAGARPQIPQGTQLVDPKTGLVTNQWYSYFAKMDQALPPSGASGVIDATANITGPTVIYQNVFAARPGSVKQYLYFSLDTGEIFTVNNVTGAWQLQIPTFTGDVTNLPNSKTLLLSDTGVTAGTYGNATYYPSITVDSAGRIQSASNILVPVSSVNGQTGPVIITLKQLSPQTTKGDLIGYSTTLNPVRIPVGTDGQVLVADSTTDSGLAYKDQPDLLFRFNYGDASPSPLMITKADKLIYTVEIIIDTPFNGVGAALAVGDASVPDQLMATTQNDPSMAITWATTPSYKYLVDTQLILTITPGAGATAGSGWVRLTIQP